MKFIVAYDIAESYRTIIEADSEDDARERVGSGEYDTLDDLFMYGTVTVSSVEEYNG